MLLPAVDFCNSGTIRRRPLGACPRLDRGGGGLSLHREDPYKYALTASLAGTGEAVKGETR